MINSADPDQKPSDLDLHCLPRQGMPCSAREGLRVNVEVLTLFKYVLHVMI